jgi:hypothetical protein
LGKLNAKTLSIFSSRSLKLVILRIYHFFAKNSEFLALERCVMAVIAICSDNNGKADRNEENTAITWTLFTVIYRDYEYIKKSS